MSAQRYRADPPGALAIRSLGDFALIYHRPSGQTHLLAWPASALLDLLGEGEADALTLVARLAEREGVDAAEGAAEVVEARLAELAEAGLVQPA